MRGTYRPTASGGITRCTRRLLLYLPPGRYQTVFCEKAEGRRKPRNERAFGQHGVIIGSLARHLPFAAQNSRGHLAERPETDSRRRAVLKWRRLPDTDLDTAMHAGVCTRHTRAVRGSGRHLLMVVSFRSAAGFSFGVILLEMAWLTVVPGRKKSGRAVLFVYVFARKTSRLSFDRVVVDGVAYTT